MVFFNLLSIIGKNFRILSRSKFSSLIMILGPLLIVLLVGTAFNSSTLNTINIGTYSDSYNNLTNSIIKDFEEKSNGSYSVEKTKSKEECIKNVKTAKNHLCVVFPGKLSMGMKNSTVDIYSDPSRMDIAYLLIQEIDSRISSKSKKMGKIKVDELIESVKNTRKELGKYKKEIRTVKSKAENIKSKTQEISLSVPDFEKSVNRLDTARNDLGEIPKKIPSECSENCSFDYSSKVYSLTDSAEDDINGTLSEISQIESSIKKSEEEISKKKENITKTSKKTEKSLKDIRKKLNNLSKSLNKVEILKAENIITPIETNVKPLTPNKNNWDFLFPTFITIVILFCSIILSSTVVLKEKKGGAYFRNFLTSTSDLTFLIGKYLTCLIIVLLQIAIVFEGVILVIGMELGSKLIHIYPIVFLASTIFIFMGLFIGYLFKSEETVLLTSISIASLFLFFSNAIFPIEAVSGVFKYIAFYNPVALIHSIFREMLIFNAKIPSLMFELYILAGMVVASFIIAIISKKLTRRCL